MEILEVGCASGSFWLTGPGASEPFAATSGGLHGTSSSMNIESMLSTAANAIFWKKLVLA